MKKIFLIPLMTLLTCVMAFATVRPAGTYAELQNALSAANDGDVIELTADIDYPASSAENELININKSITLDGKGHTIWGLAKAQLHATGSGQVHYTVIAVNHNAFGSTAELEVTIKNLTLGNISKTEKNDNGEAKAIVNARCYGIVAYDGVKKLTLENDSIETGLIQSGDVWKGPSNQQPLCVTGTKDAPIHLTIKNSHLNSGNGAYPVYILKPIEATLTNVTTEGWCALYFKYKSSATSGARTTYGEDVVGARGSVVTANNCAFNAPNIHEGQSNSFAVFPIEDDGITLTLNNCSMNAERFTKQAQMVFSLQYGQRLADDEELAPVIVNINGDNTHLYNVELEKFALSGWNTNDDNYPTTYTPKYTNAPLHMNITGGTFTVNPSQIKFRNYDSNGENVVWEYAYIDPAKYEVKELTQGGTPLYRVVPKTTALYNLNDNVENEGKGKNEATSFELSTGTTMELDANREITTAGYVQVKDNASDEGTTVKVGTVESETKIDQTLIINNGLDVSGNSQVIVQAGSALVIGEGGIITEDPENIVIEANQNGAASLLLDPAITVNQTPELTVKMTAQQVGKMSRISGSGYDYYWHRFALPVDKVQAGDGSWTKDSHSYGTLLYAWDYTNNEWASLTDLNQMKPFVGYTLSIDELAANPGELKNAGYIFKGKLTGNVNSTLEFSRQGYNFFGNSYTGYISVLKLVDELIGNADIDGTVWMWNSKEQQYEDVPLNALRNDPTNSRYTGENAWRAEVAPMQTFILRLLTENTDATADINYATAVWGNPRYDAATGATNAPARRVASTNDAYVRIIVADANGKKDAVKFYEDANLSDAYDKGFDGSKYMNERTVNVYATVNGENYGTVATDNIEGKMLTICTTDEIAYTISFADVEGEEYALRDNVTGKVIAIEEGTTYEFAAQPNSTVEGRFQIINRFDAPTAIENTEVKANVKGIYSITGMYLGEDFNALPAGVYVVDGVKIVK